jgi:hypothetical protein
VDIIIDTNLLLHFRRPDEIDWCALAGEKSCAIVITPVLMRELERNKVHNSNRRLRERARDAIAWIAQCLGEADPVHLREGVTLVFDEQEPLLDFAENRLSREIADDHLIASALDWAARTGHPVAMATDDSGLALKLRNRPICRIVPDDAARLGDAVDLERAEMRDLRRELEREKNRRPRLELQFGGGGTKTSVEPDEIEPPSSIEQIRAECPAMTFNEYIALDDRTTPGVRTYSKEPVDEYNEALNVYYVDYEDYLARFAAWAEVEARTVAIDLVLANLGSSPASNIDIQLSFPKYVEIFSEEGTGDEPDGPAPPEKPHPNRRTIRMGRAVPLAGPRPLSAPRAEGEPEISSDRRNAEYFVSVVKHDCAFELEPLFLRFASCDAMKPVPIEAVITCNEADRVINRLLVFPNLRAAPAKPGD